jgi:hypothetical protein
MCLNKSEIRDKIMGDVRNNCKLYNVCDRCIYSVWKHRNVSKIQRYRHAFGMFISVINQLEAQNFCFTLSLFHATTCFEHTCSSSGGQNCITQPLVIITPIGVYHAGAQLCFSLLHGYHPNPATPKLQHTSKQEHTTNVVIR